MGPSGDPLVDEQQEREEAVKNMIDSLLKKGEDSLLAQDTNKQHKSNAAQVVLVGGATADSGDPLADALEQERKARDKLVNDLLNNRGLTADQTPEGIDHVLEADRKTRKFPKAQKKPLELMETNLRAEIPSLMLTAERRHEAATGDFTQLLGGALIMVAAVALVAVVGRRRKPKQREAEDGEYQLFM